MREKDRASSAENLKGLSLLWNFIPAPYFAATAAYCCSIFYLSSRSVFPVPPPFEHFDKVAHFFLLGGLSATVAVGLARARHQYSAGMLFLISFGFATIYGITDEIHQLFVPFRVFSVADMAANALGAAAAAAFLAFIWQKRERG